MVWLVMKVLHRLAGQGAGPCVLSLYNFAVAADKDAAGKTECSNKLPGSAMDHSWVPLCAWRRLHLVEARQCAGNSHLSFLQHVPVMSATVLALDNLLHDPCVDLRRAAQLILSDVGATIQILLLVGKESDSTAQRLSRMGDCLASLDVGTWFGVISAAPTFPADREHTALTTVWKHCRLVAQYAQLVAESLDGVSPEDAYLVGLLHEIEAIPIVLGWPNGDAAPWCAIEASLPLFVLAAMRVVNDACALSTWRCILTEAHELAGACSRRPQWSPLVKPLISSHSFLTDSSPALPLNR